MLEIKSFCFGPFGTNTYVVRDDENKVYLIDPACASPYEEQVLLTYLKIQEFEDLKIIATHGHLDHLWGAAWASEQWHTPVYMHEADISMAEAMQEQYDLFGVHRKAEPFPIENLQSPISNLKFDIIHTPGHTPGSICLYWEKEKVLLSGDTLFHMGYGRTDLPGGNTSELIASLDYLFTLPADVKVYPGHGDFTTIGAEARFL